MTQRMPDPTKKTAPRLLRTLALAGALAASVHCGDETGEVDLRGDGATSLPPARATDMDAAITRVPAEDPSEAGGSLGADAGVDDDAFVQRVVTQGLAAPWEVAYGPDDQLWITERTGKRVVRVDPRTGARTTALQIDDVHQSSGQDGLLGMALHPGLLRGRDSDYVYVAYTYDADDGPAVTRRAKIVRYGYDVVSHTLGDPRELLRGLPASDDHNSGRLAYGPDDHLYYTIGDQGSNQFENKCKPIRAQDLPSRDEVTRADWSSYQGKILRLEPDGAIPADNPVLAGVRSHVYSYGHRNAQGLAFGPGGKLYASEQGPKTDDELNLIEAGKNYGWPHVAGHQDDKAYLYGNWSAARATPCSALTFDEYVLPDFVPTERESAWVHPDFRPPLTTFYTVESGFDFRACTGGAAYICWPTIAPSSLDLYVGGAEGVPGWGPSLLVTSLKQGSVFRIGLDADGTTAEPRSTQLFKTINRYRDLTISPDKKTFYVVTDSGGDTSGPAGAGTQSLAHRGAILEFRLAR